MWLKGRVAEGMAEGLRPGQYAYLSYADMHAGHFFFSAGRFGVLSFTCSDAQIQTPNTSLAL